MNTQGSMLQWDSWPQEDKFMGMEMNLTGWIIITYDFSARVNIPTIPVARTRAPLV